MSNIKVYRASAGSGKTHRLTGDYLQMAFAEDFRNILAVTFTNKATAGMKGRILEELFMLSQGKDSAFAGIAGATGAAARINAAGLLEAILQKYAWFSVSTIDSFLSGIFKSFLLEIGVSSIYDIELNQDAVLEKITASLFEKVDSNPELRHWLSRFARERIETGSGWDMKKQIMSLGGELFKESWKLMEESGRRKFADKDFLNSYRQELLAIQNTYLSTLKKTGQEAMQAITSRGLTAADFKQTNRGIYGHFLSWSEGNPRDLNSYALACVYDPGEWEGKGPNREAVAALRDELLGKLLQDVWVHMQENLALYKTAEAILGHFHTIGILGDLSAGLQQLTREENKILLSEAAALLRDIVGENDASFVFEKAGNLYRNFMVDEFQDTSLIQWQTLVPLVKNGLSENGFCMLVGDVKQSIYRWRNGDWELLAGKAMNDLHPFAGTTEDLATNWRSTPEVITFNNFLFGKLPNILQSQYNSEVAASALQPESISQEQIISLYMGNGQLVSEKMKDARGFVRLYCMKKDREQPGTEEMVAANLPAMIARLLHQGFRLRDMAILVRRKTEGNTVTRLLREHSGRELEGKIRQFDFISEENLYLDESPAVYMLLAALKYFACPADKINLVSLVHAWNSRTGKNILQNDMLSAKAGNEELLKHLPEPFTGALQAMRRLSLVALCEQIIPALELDKDPAASPYLMAFMDQVLSFSKGEKGGVAAFLEWWDGNRDKFSLTVNENQDAIRVMTIHKSKGLQFRVVFVPFCDWPLDHGSRMGNILWCNTHGHPFNMLEKVPVRYSSGLAETLFAPDYFREKQKAYIDNLNLLYVALTRAEQGLVVFAPYGDKEKEMKTTGDLLYSCASGIRPDDSVEFTIHPGAFDGEGLTIEYGEITAEWKKKPASTEDHAGRIMDHYPVSPFAERLTIAYRGKEFFEQGESQVGEGLLRGRVMHELFSLIRSKEDISAAADRMISQGKLPKARRENIIAGVRELLSQPIAGEWFSGEWIVFNESDLLVPGTGIRRPDRVMVKNKQAVVVDYKFGLIEDRQYEAQVKDYCRLMQEMGHSDVQGFIWYVGLKKTVKVV